MRIGGPMNLLFSVKEKYGLVVKTLNLKCA